MELRFYIDPDSGEPHIYRHQVPEREAEDVLRRPIEDRAGRDGSRVAIGQTRAAICESFMCSIQNLNRYSSSPPWIWVLRPCAL